MDKTTLTASALAIGVALTFGTMELKCVGDDAVLKVGDEKICIEQEADYQIFKDDKIAQWEKDYNKKEKENSLGYFATMDDLNVFIAIINEENERGNLQAASILNNKKTKQTILSLKSK